MIRITWRERKNANVTGHGEWYPNGARQLLEGWLIWMNRDFPNLYHFIEERKDDGSSNSEAETS